MKPYREIEFTTTRIKGDLTVGKTCYQGLLQHNAVLSEKEARRRFAECCNQEPFETNKYIDAPRQFEVTGLIPPVHPSQPDEGVWLEGDAGEKVAVATVVSSSLSHADCTLDGSLERGDYWIVIQRRYQDEPDLIRRRRIRVV